MGIITALVRPTATAPGPLDDYWYQPVGTSSVTAAGTRVSDDSVLGLPGFWAAVNLRANILGHLPLHLYRRAGPKGIDREQATEHSLYRILHDQPNALQTSMQFRKWKETCKILRGNAYAYIWRDNAGEVKQLIPLHPDFVKPEKTTVGMLPCGLPEVGLRYKVKTGSGNEITLLRDEVHHTIGFSLDGLIGVSVIEKARSVLGTAQAVKEHQARFFGNGARPGGILAPKERLNQDALDRLKQQWNQTFQGAANSHKVAALPVDVTYTALGISNEDSQLLETDEHLVRECARLLEIPPHLIGETSKTTTWGTGVEQMTIGFVVYHIGPWLEDDEQALKRDLIPEDDLYAEHSVEGLLRGDSKSRAEFFQTLRQNGVINAEDWARKENLPAPEGAAAKAYWRPANMADANAPPEEPPSAPGAEMPGKPPTKRMPDEPMMDDEGKAFGRDAAARYVRLMQAAAERVVRRETAAMARIATREADDPDEWRRLVEAFYADHSAYVSEAMQIQPETASVYVIAHRDALMTHGAGVMSNWSTVGVQSLVALAIDESEKVDK